MASQLDKTLRAYLARLGRKGGKARAEKYSKATLSKWAKKGGYPRTEKGKRDAN